MVNMDMSKKNRKKLECADCGLDYLVLQSYRYDICPGCREELREHGIDPNHQQPVDKGDYRPRYNGLEAWKYDE